MTERSLRATAMAVRRSRPSARGGPQTLARRQRRGPRGCWRAGAAARRSRKTLRLRSGLTNGAGHSFLDGQVEFSDSRAMVTAGSGCTSGMILHVLAYRIALYTPVVSEFRCNLMDGDRTLLQHCSRCRQ